jgi:hypothetical protein
MFRGGVVTSLSFLILLLSAIRRAHSKLSGRLFYVFCGESS